VKEINLSKGKKALVDDEDFEHLSQLSWHAVDNHGLFYPVTIYKTKDETIFLPMHRFLIHCPAGLEIDHIDRNPLNNQKSNLRAVTHKENCNNREPADPICPKCGIRKKYRKSYAYCKECFLEYMKQRRKNNPELKKKSTEYKRQWRAKQKNNKSGE